MNEEPKKRRQRIPTGELRDRNTIRMVADYWGVSTTHVRRLIEGKELACLQLGGTVRITREQVQACELAHLREATREDDAADRMRAWLDERRMERAVLRARRVRVKAGPDKV